MESAGGNEPSLARRHRERLAVVHHLLAVTGQDVEDLVGVGMVVAGVGLPPPRHPPPPARRPGAGGRPLAPGPGPAPTPHVGWGCARVLPPRVPAGPPPLSLR